MQVLRTLILASVVVCALAAPQTTGGAKVLGGEDAEAGEFPYMVSLRRSSNRHFCGGSIISDRVILTAGHCVEGSSPSAVTVVSGTINLDAGGNRHDVSEIIVHAAFDPEDSWRNDVALLKLSTPINFTALEKSIDLPSQDEIPNPDSIVSGWGYTRYPGSTLPNNLQKVKLLVDNDKCDSQHDINVYPTQVCAGTVSGEGVCNGDSGGPLVSGGKQIGIVSWGQPCAVGVPDVYTRVASYADWIVNNSA